MQPFDYRTSAAFWDLSANPAAAFAHHAFVGGTPAYRSLADDDTPADGDVDAWVQRRLLEPSSSLFRDGRIVIAEDAQLGDQQRYWGLLAAIADGAVRWGDLEAVLGQSRGSLQHALQVAMDAGWVVKREDPLRANRSVCAVSEPMVRFHRVVIEPNQQRLDARRKAEVWRDVRPLVAAQILAPHLEMLAEDWLIRHALADTTGGALTTVGPTVLKATRSEPGQQYDLAGVESTARGGSRLILIGEVKATDARVGSAELQRPRSGRQTAQCGGRLPTDPRLSKRLHHRP